MKSSLSLAIICIVCVGFVDDTDLPMSGATVDTPGEDIQQDFQTLLDRWTGALHVTGGELDPKKSWCYFIDFRWTGTAWQYRNKDDMPADFTLNDKEGMQHTLKRLDPSQGSETLGIFLAMDRTHVDHFNSMKAKGVAFADKIRVSNCSPNVAIYTFKFCFLPSLQYSMCVSNFTEKEWISIIAPAKIATLNKAQMAATFPVDMLYGTSKYNRFDFEDPYTRQGIEKLATFMQEAPRNTQAGIVTRNRAKDFRMQLGMNYTMGTIDWTTAKELVTTNT